MEKQSRTLAEAILEGFQTESNEQVIAETLEAIEEAKKGKKNEEEEEDKEDKEEEE